MVLIVIVGSTVAFIKTAENILPDGLYVLYYTSSICILLAN